MAISLLTLAQQFCEDHQFLSDPDEAEGRCLWSVLMFAARAAENELFLYLIRWSVRNDSYIDHWAVRLNHWQVIDFTRAQIDKKRGYVFDVDDYPGNYQNRRVYPAALFLKHFPLAENSQADGQMSTTTLRNFARTRIKYDRQRQKPEPWEAIGWLILLGCLAFFIALLLH